MVTASRNSVAYVTNDGTGRWLRLDVPDGLISPPIIQLHEPLVGCVDFYYAECYHLPIPKDAKVSEPARLAQVAEYARTLANSPGVGNQVAGDRLLAILEETR